MRLKGFKFSGDISESGHQQGYMIYSIYGIAQTIDTGGGLAQSGCLILVKYDKERQNKFIRVD